MANLNESLKEGVCVDEEVFFGPMSEKERKIREQFENIYRNENQSSESHKIIENDNSKNDSLYKSFSVEESKYDSFEDSLNEEIDKMPCEAKHVTIRKSFDKLKSKKHGFYDSLEDVGSLISNIDKCSISCEVENHSNFNNKHIIEDSLKNPPVAIATKSIVSEQVHFDDDSLAIIEYENTFDDSLEEMNVLESIEIEDIDDIENVVVESQNVAVKIDQNYICAPKNLFDTSVQIVCEKMKDCDIVDQEESSDDKNLLYDSLSNSDFKDILKDSLEESEKLSENLNVLKHVSDATTLNIGKPENIYINQNTFDTSVQIIYENSHKFSHTENISEKTSSEYNDISKDSLDNSKNVDRDPVENKIADANEHSLQSSNINTAPNQGVFTPQKLSKSSACTNDNKNALSSDSNANQDDKKLQDYSVTESATPICTSDNANLKKETFSVDSCHLKILNDNINIDKDLKFQLHIEVTVGDKKCQIASRDIQLVSTSQNSTNEIDSVSTDPIQSSLMSPVQCIAKCVSQEKVLDTLHSTNFELNSENEDCNHSKETASLNLKNEIDFASVDPVESSVMSSAKCINEEKVLDTLHSSNPEVNTKIEDSNVSGENVFYEKNSSKKSSKTSTSNVTQRKKSSHSFDYSEKKFSYSHGLNNISLLQALDLHDISSSLLNESVIQSKDSLMPLNLCSRDQCVQNFHTPIFRNESKENVPAQVHQFEKKVFCASSKIMSPNKMYISKTPKSLQKCLSFKETSKKTPGTRIPVRKVENFAIPVAASTKLAKQTSSLSAEKVKKCQHSPHSVDSGKKTPATTPNKAPHLCKVRNTIFSKVPQIVPSKKYMNIQSPVAQYIKNNHGPVRTPVFDPVLRDCMNLPSESPYHSHQTPKGGSLKLTKKKA